MNTDDFFRDNSDKYTGNDEDISVAINTPRQKINLPKTLSYSIFTALYIACIFLTAFIGSINYHSVFFNGLIAQLEVILSVLLSLLHTRRAIGCITAYILNAVTISVVIFTLINTKNISILVGCIVPISTVFIITILSIRGRLLYKSLHELEKQRGELIALAEETRHAYDEVSSINESLIASNKKIEESDAKLTQLAFFDSLTDLPNRRMIMNRLDFQKSFTEITHNRFTVVFFDIDNFKNINDGFGHAVGDLLLREIADRLRKRINTADLLGRLVGDEFALLIQRPLTNEETVVYVNELLSNLTEPFDLGSSSVSISVTVGASVYPDDSTSSSELFGCADIALHHAKSNPNTRFEFYDGSMREAIEKRTDFEARLVGAIKNNELFMMYQPQYTANEKKLIGFEALVRWNSPELGFVSPVQFIPMAEETGHIIELGMWILEQACNKLNEINRTEGLENISVAVNISAVQLAAPDFLRQVMTVLDRTKVVTFNLEFEITESVFIKSIDDVTETLNALRELGIRISLDDFGTGYSSLSYLHSLPIHTLKIDKSFIDGITRKESEKEMVGSIISLAHNLSLFVVSEGVETDEQFEYLRSQNCDCIQGFLLGKPLSDNEMQGLLLSEAVSV